MNQFHGKTALIIGGASGIGLETAKLLLTGGAKVTIVGRNRQKLDRAAENLEALGEYRRGKAIWQIAQKWLVSRAASMMNCRGSNCSLIPPAYSLRKRF
jgi:NAD(P)-dependent dehydrogenase (short-subunit alcohol dehydrogenase family)